MGGEGKREEEEKKKKKPSAIKLPVQFEGWENLYLLMPRSSTGPGTKKSSINISE